MTTSLRELRAPRRSVQGMKFVLLLIPAAVIFDPTGHAQRAHVERVVETQGIWSLVETGLANGKTTCLIEGVPLRSTSGSTSGRLVFYIVRKNMAGGIGGITGFAVERYQDRPVNWLIPMTYGSVQIDGHPAPTTLVDNDDMLRLEGDVGLIAKAHSLIVTYGFRGAAERTVSYDLTGLPEIYARFETEC
jgi:hypothetical protein